MYHGVKTNIEIQLLIDSGVVSYMDTVMSKDWNELLRYNGTTFEGTCTCREVGTQPVCSVIDCPPVKEAIGSFSVLVLT